MMLEVVAQSIELSKPKRNPAIEAIVHCLAKEDRTTKAVMLHAWRETAARSREQCDQETIEDVDEVRRWAEWAAGPGGRKPQQLSGHTVNVAELPNLTDLHEDI